MDKKVNSKDFFKTLQIIYGAFILGIVVFFIFTYTSVENPVIEIDTDDFFTLIVPIVTFSSVFFKQHAV